MIIYIVAYIAVVIMIYALLNIIPALLPAKAVDKLSGLKNKASFLWLRKQRRSALRKPWSILSMRFADITVDQIKARRNFLNDIRIFLKPLIVLNERYLTHGKTIEAYQYKFAIANLDITTEEFFAFKEVCALIAAALIFLLGIKANILLYLCFIVIGFMAPDMWLAKHIKKQHHRIVQLLPEVIDILTLCIGAGLDLSGAINKVIAEFSPDEPLIRSLSLASHEMKMGKRRAEALKTMAQRTGSNEIAAFIRAVVQSDRMGTPLISILKTYSEDVRMKRFQQAERQALKAPIKLLVPLIFCIMPCVGILVASPVFIQFTRQNPFGEKTQAQQAPAAKMPEAKMPKMEGKEMSTIKGPKPTMMEAPKVKEPKMPKM